MSETPSACVPLALDGAASGLVLSCSTAVSSRSEYFISAWEPDEVCSLKFGLLTSPYLLGCGLVTCSGPGPLSSHSPNFPLTLGTLL